MDTDRNDGGVVESPAHTRLSENSLESPVATHNKAFLIDWHLSIRCPKNAAFLQLLSSIYSRARPFIFRALFLHFMFTFSNASTQNAALALK